MSRYRIYAGSYTDKSADKLGSGRGIYVYEFNTSQNELRLLSVYADSKDPSFLCIEGENLYAAEEMPQSVISHFKIKDGGLKKEGAIPINQKDSCHVQLMPDKRHLSVANYGSGSLTIIELSEDGGMKRILNTIEHYGHSVHPRQTMPRVHSTLNSPDGKYLLAADLGTDTVTVYEPDAEGNLTKVSSMGVLVPSGRGPRHMAFSPDRKRLFIVGEISGTLLIYAYDEKKGIGELLEERSLADSLTEEPCKPADIHFSPDGGFLYVSVRGTNEILCMAYDKGNVGEAMKFSSFGDSPRNFCITEDGNYLITANEFSGNIAVIERDVSTGRLGKCIQTADIPRAVFVTAVKEG